MSIQAVLVDGVLVFASTENTDKNETTTITPDEQQLRPGLDETDVTPGLPGFLATFAIALAIIFILLNMTKRMRRMGHATGNTHRVTAEFSGARPTRPGTASTNADASAPSQTADADNSGQGPDVQADQSK